MHSFVLAGTRTDQKLLLFLSIPLLAVNIGCGISLWKLVAEQSGIKEDYAQVNSIRNGLLSVGVWKSHLEAIASKKLDNPRFTPEQEEIIRTAIEKAIDALILQVDQTMQKPQKTLRGKMRKIAFKVFVDTESLTEQSPHYAQAVIDEVRKPENMRKIKALAVSKIEETKNDDAESDPSPMKALLAKYGAASVNDFNRRAGELVRDYDKRVRAYVAVMIGTLFLFLVIGWWVRGKPHLYRPLYALSVVLAFILLLSALALPMIDIDARIQNIDFRLAGEHLQFTNQLLYFRSKSIMQMVKILMAAGKPQTVFVGFLILLFSIIFPITKLTSALFCLFGGEKLRTRRWVHFFAYESGKWSMADVLVVAIFMAYIGFNGVLNDQLKNLDFKSQSLGVIATNETALQAGFTLFLAFVLFGLALSAVLKKIVPPTAN